MGVELEANAAPPLASGGTNPIRSAEVDAELDIDGVEVGELPEPERGILRYFSNPFVSPADEGDEEPGRMDETGGANVTGAVYTEFIGV